MIKHKNDPICTVPFCRECLSNIKNMASVAKELMTTPESKDEELDIKIYVCECYDSEPHVHLLEIAEALGLTSKETEE